MKTNLVRVTDLFIYPLKSAQPIPLKTMNITATGPQFDRQWMLIDEGGQFVSQRTHPKMCMIEQQLDTTHLTVHGPKMTPLQIPLIIDSSENKEALLFSTPVNTLWVGTQYDQWFSELFQQKLFLVTVPTPNKRTTPHKYDPHNTSINFPDGFPFLLAANETLAELNSYLDAPVTMDRFRPNIVIEGAQANEEDTWEFFNINNVEFSGVKDCSRCSVITVDQKSGEKDNSPMSALLKYRKKNGKVIFGQNLVHFNNGQINVGDQLIVQ